MSLVGNRLVPFLLLCGLLLFAPGCDDTDTVRTPESVFSVALTVQDTQGAATSTFSPGETVVFVVVVTNLATSPATLHYPDSQLYDFDVSENSGRHAWTWSNGGYFLQVITDVEYDALQTRVYSVEWTQVGDDGEDAGAGSYEVQALLPCRNPMTSNRVSFEIR